MKKLLTFVTAMLLVGSTFADVGPVGRSVQLDGAGAVKAGSVEKWFINCKNTSGGALENGDVVIADVSNDDGYSCTTSTTAGAVPLCVLAEACASAAMCKCQTWGLKTDVNFDVTNGNSTAGEMVFISENNAGDVQAAISSSIAAFDYPVGVFYDSSTSSGDVEVFIRLR